MPIPPDADDHGGHHGVTTPLSAYEREQRKTELQRAEDIAYTINHTLTCLSLDIFVPIISTYYTRWRHGGGAHADAAQAEGVGTHLKEWFTGEIVGDLGAVPLTIAMQRMAPGAMEQINSGMETLLGPAYRWGAQRSARKWAHEHGLPPDGPEMQAHAEQLYRHEVNHLAQAAIWTLGAFALNVATQKAIGSSYSTRQIVEGKLVGALTATSTVLGARAIAPEGAKDWDRWTSEHIFLPATRVLGGLIGVDSEAVERLAQKERSEYGNAPATATYEIKRQGMLSPPAAQHRLTP